MDRATPLPGYSSTTEYTNHDLCNPPSSPTYSRTYSKGGEREEFAGLVAAQTRPSQEALDALDALPSSTASASVGLPSSVLQRSGTAETESILHELDLLETSRGHTISVNLAPSPMSGGFAPRVGLFDAIDRDGNGVIDRAEFETWEEAKWKFQQEQQQQQLQCPLAPPPRLSVLGSPGSDLSAYPDARSLLHAASSQTEEALMRMHRMHMQPQSHGSGGGGGGGGMAVVGGYPVPIEPPRHSAPAVTPGGLFDPYPPAEPPLPFLMDPAAMAKSRAEAVSERALEELRVRNSTVNARNSGASQLRASAEERLEALVSGAEAQGRFRGGGLAPTASEADAIRDQLDRMQKAMRGPLPSLALEPQEPAVQDVSLASPVPPALGRSELNAAAASYRDSGTSTLETNPTEPLPLPLAGSACFPYPPGGRMGVIAGIHTELDALEAGASGILPPSSGSGGVDRGTSPLRYLSPGRERPLLGPPAWQPPILPLWEGIPGQMGGFPPGHPAWGVPTAVAPCPVPTAPCPAAAGPTYAHGFYGHTGVVGLAAGLVGEMHPGLPRGYFTPTSAGLSSGGTSVGGGMSEEQRAMQAAREQYKALSLHFTAA